MWSRAATAKENTQSLHWAVTKVGDSRLLGYAALNSIDLARRQAELRVWAACTAEHPMAAAGWSQHLLRFSFERVGLKRVYALQLARHPAAGQLLESIGMHPVG
jgi:RimJ/RimL family protein N-acetyltransferase